MSLGGLQHCGQPAPPNPSAVPVDDLPPHSRLRPAVPAAAHRLQQRQVNSDYCLLTVSPHSPPLGPQAQSRAQSRPSTPARSVTCSTAAIAANPSSRRIRTASHSSKPWPPSAHGPIVRSTPTYSCAFTLTSSSRRPSRVGGERHGEGEADGEGGIEASEVDGGRSEEAREGRHGQGEDGAPLAGGDGDAGGVDCRAIESGGPT